MRAWRTIRTGVSLREVPGRSDPVPARPRVRPFPIWPVLLLTCGAFAATWGGWVGLGGLCGFGPINLLPGIGRGWTINSAITLPIGMETYAAYAMGAWLTGRPLPDKARKFAKVSSLVALGIGSLGQILYHLMIAAGWTRAPWPVTILVSCVPVMVLGLGAGLAHLVRSGSEPGTHDEDQADAVDVVAQLETELRNAVAAPEVATPVSPAPAGPRRTAEQIVELDDFIAREHPGLNAVERARLVGASDRHVRECRRKVREAQQ